MREFDYILHCDGSIKGGNPGGHAVGGWVLTSGLASIIGYGCVDLKNLPSQTNNAAEYSAVFGGLRYIQDVCTRPWKNKRMFGVIIHTDSDLVVKQLQKKWKVISPELRLWHQLVSRYAGAMHTVYRWIPRGENKKADAVSRLLYQDNEEWPKDSEKYNYFSLGKEGACP